MASATTSQPSAALTDNGNKDVNPTERGNEWNAGQKDIQGDDKGIGTAGVRRAPGTCLPKSQEIPALPIKSDGLEADIQYMKDHALIAKFVGIWPMEKNLIWWINHHWKPKGGYELRLGAKGFFTVVFNNLEDKNRIFEGRSYFYNSTGLYLTFSKERFNPDKVDLSVAQVWLRLYSLPCELWRREILADIGNTLGVFIKVAEQTRRMRYVSYVRICVYLDI